MERKEILECLPDPRLLIGGERVQAAGGGDLDVEDPARAESIATVAAGGAEDIRAAVDAAGRAAGGPWRDLDPRDRGLLLHRLASLVKRHAEALAALTTLEVGKPLSESRKADLPGTIDCITWYAGLADKVEGRTIPVRGGAFACTVREPVGVVGAIVPWNFPLLMAATKLAPALAAGCTVVLKPAEETPLTALFLAGLIQEAGFPPGVVNVVNGTGEIAGRALVEDPDVSLISFTGSTEVGREIMERSARFPRPVVLELGGKSPNIVLGDVSDPGQAIAACANAVFFNQGEVCTAGTRILVHESLYTSFVEGLIERARAVTVGDPFQRSTRMGAQVSAGQLERIMGCVERGKAEGARLAWGGERFEVTVFADVPPEATIAREEIFGPVACVTPFHDEDEAIRLANDNPYGLAAGLWTRDAARARELAGRLDVGTVWVNGYGRFDCAVPYGGRKASGFSREDGHEGLDAYLSTKAIWF